MEKITSILSVKVDKKSFGSSDIIKNIELDIQEGEFITILGKSGIGKSTLLKLISGIDTTYAGKILFKDSLLREPTKSISLLFQGHFLLPWLTVEENIKFFVDEVTDRNIGLYLDSVGISDKRKEWPNKLSGGEKTRVGLSAALINKSDLLLLDEPFADIDIGVKFEILSLLREVKVRNNTTIVMTTHNIEDALILGNRVVVIDGKPSTVVLDTIISDNNKVELKEKITSILTS